MSSKGPYFVFTNKHGNFAVCYYMTNYDGAEPFEELLYYSPWYDSVKEVRAECTRANTRWEETH